MPVTRNPLPATVVGGKNFGATPAGEKADLDREIMRVYLQSLRDAANADIVSSGKRLSAQEKLVANLKSLGFRDDHPLAKFRIKPLLKGTPAEVHEALTTKLNTIEDELVGGSVNQAAFRGTPELMQKALLNLGAAKTAATAAEQQAVRPTGQTGQRSTILTSPSGIPGTPAGAAVARAGGGGRATILTSSQSLDENDLLGRKVKL